MDLPYRVVMHVYMYNVSILSVYDGLSHNADM